MQSSLQVVSGPDQGRSFPLEEGVVLLVGRGQETPTRLKDPQVSRVHCQVTMEDGRVLLKHMSKSGNTLVNGRMVTEHELRPGEIIHIGGTQLRYELEGAHEASTVMGLGPQSKALSNPASLDDLVGKTLSHFQIKSIIAHGQSGTVFKAVDTRDSKEVALKVLSPEYSQNDEDVQRFIRAMKTMMPLRHPNLIAILGAGKQESHCWMAMELVEGDSVKKLIEKIGVAGMLDWKNALRVAVQIARALVFAEEHQIIHRNISPTNIIVRSSDKVAKLGDLMLAKALEGALAKQITKPGQLLGDIAYMSPERTRSIGEVDSRSDIYSLGATVYALLTGRPPCEGSSLPETIAKIRNAEPVRPKKYQLSIPDQFEGAVMQMLAKRPEDRQQRAKDLLADLERVAKFQGMVVE
jgi:serine/threonine protein kinase